MNKHLVINEEYKVIGNLTYSHAKYITTNRGQEYRYFYNCTCGNTTMLTEKEVLNKSRTKCSSCYSKEIDTIKDIINRIIKNCTNSKANSYSIYGDKGTKVSEEWITNRYKFVDWCIKNNFKIHESFIDRIDRTKDFTPDNCIIVTNKTAREENLKSNIKIGDKIGHLTVVAIVDNLIEFKCDCTDYVIIDDETFSKGNIDHCGCFMYNKYTNHKSKAIPKLYNTWSVTKTRCYCSTNKDYKNYGAKGIQVCNEWRYDYSLFEKWSLENGFSEDLFLDTIDRTGDYTPDNCKWVPMHEYLYGRREVDYKYDINADNEYGRRFRYLRDNLKVGDTIGVMKVVHRDGLEVYMDCAVCGAPYDTDIREVAKHEYKYCNHIRKPGMEFTKGGYIHGATNSSLFSVWDTAIARCTRPSHKSYPTYGGRGISVCDEWSKVGTGYFSFRKWALANGFKKGLTLDRIDGNGDYCPENCRWVTSYENSLNKDNVYCIDGLPLSLICKERGVDYDLVRARVVNYGWDLERALTEPKRPPDNASFLAAQAKIAAQKIAEMKENLEE